MVPGVCVPSPVCFKLSLVRHAEWRPIMSLCLFRTVSCLRLWCVTCATCLSAEERDSSQKCLQLGGGPHTSLNELMWPRLIMHKLSHFLLHWKQGFPFALARLLLFYEQSIKNRWSTEALLHNRKAFIWICLFITTFANDFVCRACCTLNGFIHSFQCVHGLFLIWANKAVGKSVCVWRPQHGVWQRLPGSRKSVSASLGAYWQTWLLLSEVTACFTTEKRVFFLKLLCDHFYV